MFKSIHRITLVVATLLLAVSTSFSIPTIAHSSHDSHHSSESVELGQCSAVCTSVAVNKNAKEDDIQEDKKDDDAYRIDVPGSQAMVDAYMCMHESSALRASELHPPPGHPNYIVNAVFRV